MKSRSILLFGASAALSASLNLAPDALAASHRQIPVHACMSEQTVGSSSVGVENGHSHWTSSSDGVMYCGYTSDTSYARLAADTIDVYIWQTVASTMAATACISYRTSSTVSCGSSSTSSSSGYTTLTPGLGTWNSALNSGTPYVAVTVTNDGDTIKDILVGFN